MSFSGCGLGLRREFLFDDLSNIDFFEITPENWFHIPSKYQERFGEIMSGNFVISHGLSLSIGSFEELNFDYLKELKNFLDRYGISIYSEHLSFTSLNNKSTFELLPIFMSKKSANFIAEKLLRVQDFLKRDVILENPTYYFSLENEISEVEFMEIIHKKSKCKFLLDVNNVYVNSVNHSIDCAEFLSFFDSKNVAYLHIAGHKNFNGILIDTHGESVSNDVFELLDYTYKLVGKKPTLLERDNNIPDLSDLKVELSKMRDIYEKRA